MNKNFIAKIFGKEKEHLILNDLKDFFAEAQEETSVLEFKSGNVEIIDLYKEVAAFLNTEGGLIIIGSPREESQIQGGVNNKVCVGDLTYSRFKGKDWLLQKIVSNITAPPIGINIVEFVEDEGSIYLIDVPQSFNPPHQCAADGRYYIRMEREAKPAPHGLVQALFNKRKTPILTAEISAIKTSSINHEITICLRNKSSIPADKVSILIDVYNVNEMGSELSFTYYDNDGINKFSHNQQLDQVLVQLVKIPFKFEVVHGDKNYIVFVGYWTKDSDFDFNYTVIDFKSLERFNEGNRTDGPVFGDLFRDMIN